MRSVLNTPATTRMGFWSINPYVGCEFGCTYCYARDTHRYAMERSGRAARRADARLAGVRAAHPGQDRRRRGAGAHARPRASRRPLARHRDRHRSAISPPSGGSASRAGSCGLLLHYRGLSLGIITKSPLVTRDIDVLQQLGERHEVTVNISLATPTRGSRGGSSCARRCRRCGSGRSGASPTAACTRGSSSRQSSPASPTTAPGSRGSWQGEGGGRPLRGRVGAPARPRGAAPLPSRPRPRISRARRAVRATLRAARRGKPRLSAGAEPPAAGAAAASRIPAGRGRAAAAAARGREPRALPVVEQPSFF